VLVDVAREPWPGRAGCSQQRNIQSIYSTISITVMCKIRRSFPFPLLNYCVRPSRKWYYRVLDRLSITPYVWHRGAYESRLRDKTRE
jgi:hypothetical protein